MLIDEYYSREYDKINMKTIVAESEFVKYKSEDNIWVWQ